ncbi:class I SAM-dependent methyltransferase [Rhodococcus sp. PAE-6]|uniref:class I SAM-dependent methyltransferase n=1 Tax=Rhodococcus sp. PAE-6 TaxID=2972477 RepID=UPI0021B3715B|nr:class I SAM-dependent methyltransferase [Rhodococcus sp. PAE-6]MCT7294276.1 class I SAM-dependent methyltransferase [Rhodococcus sp. PAE-6]
MGEPVSLGEIQETLLIPLYGRAQDAQRSNSVLHDTKACEFVAAIDYDFAKFRGPSLAGAVLRASIFDEYVRRFLSDHPGGTVIDLGCGLSTRFDRLDNGKVQWFDLDVPDTMALRRKFCSDSNRYTMLDGSLFDDTWWAPVINAGGPVFVLSEAVLLYFTADEVTAQLRTLSAAFPATRLAFDTGGTAMMNTQDRNPVFKAVPARMKWTCDDPRTLEQCGMHLLESRTFATPQHSIRHTWPARYRVGLRALGWAPPVKTYKLNLFMTHGATQGDAAAI